jgi:hypothetical protein
MKSEPRQVLAGVRVGRREHLRWLKAAALEDLRLPELMREAVRAHLRDLERHRLLVRSVEAESAQQEPPTLAKAAS